MPGIAATLSKVGGDAAPVELIDTSPGGCQLESPIRADVRDRVEVSIFDRHDHRMTLSGVVTDSRPSGRSRRPGDERWRVHVAFDARSGPGGPGI